MCLYGLFNSFEVIEAVFHVCFSGSEGSNVFARHNNCPYGLRQPRFKIYCHCPSVRLLADVEMKTFFRVKRAHGFIDLYYHIFPGKCSSEAFTQG